MQTKNMAGRDTRFFLLSGVHTIEISAVQPTHQLLLFQYISKLILISQSHIFVSDSI